MLVHPPPPEKRKFYFYCRLAFSERFSRKDREGQSVKEVKEVKGAPVRGGGGAFSSGSPVLLLPLL